MAEPGWEEVKRLEADDQHRHAVILRGPHGLYRFDGFRWRKYYEPSEEDDGPIDGGWWDCDHQSGLYETFEAAEKEARSALPWLRS
jgi:hypothetical protein